MLARYSEIVQAWAGHQSVINRAWIFGSYARGTATERSDLDVAVEIMKASVGYWGMCRFWCRNGGPLQGDLRHRFAVVSPELEVNLELYHRYYGRIVYVAIRRERIAPVYRRQRSRGRSETVPGAASPRIR